MRTRNISIVGLGKLGLCVATVLASKGFNVIGIDTDRSKVDAINKGVSPIYEPRLDELLEANRHRLSGTTEFESSVAKTDATFVVVPTPSLPSGEFSSDYVKLAMENIGHALRRKDGYHLVSLMSTVMPGSMDDVVKPALERSSGKVCGQDFGLCYNPEFIALGDVVRGLLEPDFVLIGESDPLAGETLSQIHSETCNNSPRIARMNFINAELAKISVNSFVTMKMSFANTLAEICEKTPGSDVDTITQAIGMDKRIGGAYLKGALGYGGPCFPRDNIAFANHATKVGAQADLANTTHRVNQKQVRRILGLIEDAGLSPPMKVGILGLTYKPGTNVTEASQAVMLAQELKLKGFEVFAYDPALDDQSELRNAVKIEPSAEACLAKSNICVIATPWPVFSKIDKSNFAGKVVIDCWRVLNANTVQNASIYLTTGRGTAKHAAILA